MREYYMRTVKIIFGVIVLIIAVFAIFGFINGLEQFKLSWTIIMVGFWYILWCVIKDISNS